MQHFTEKKPACTPSIKWWIVVAIIYPLVQRVEATFISVQGTNTLVCEQKERFSKLLCDMQVRTNVEGPMTAQDHACPFPPMPEEQALVTPQDFSKALRNQRDRLLAKVSDEDIEDIDAQFRHLNNAYRKEAGVKVTFDAVH